MIVLFRGQHDPLPGSEKFMTAKRVVKTAPGERASPQNGLPELVPYVYRQQERRNNYAARIARRNNQGWWRPPALPDGSDSTFGADKSAAPFCG